ncbi:MAG: hypothetical protein GX334_05335 [Firmicutes bacterium]|nr:hypothetical protein [Bacillota bacterium]
MLELEKNYKESLAAALAEAEKIGRADLVVGVSNLVGLDPEHVLKTIQTGLATYFPNLKTLTVFCAASPAEKEDFQKGQPFLSDNFLSFAFDEPQLFRKGWAVRGMMELSMALGANLVLLEPGLFTSKPNGYAVGLSADWIKLLCQPILDDHAQLVFPSFRVSIMENLVAELFIFPLLAALYNLELRACSSTGLAISHDLLSGCLAGAADWPLGALEYGIDAWILTLALEQGAEVAEVFMGQKPRITQPVGLNYLFAQYVEVLFEAFGKKPSAQSWREKPAALRTPLSFGFRDSIYFHDETVPELRGYIENFRRGFSRFDEAVWSRIFPAELIAQLREIAAQPEESFTFSAALWSQIVYDSLLAYHFLPELEKEDIAYSLSPLFEGRLAGFLNEIAVRERCAVQPAVRREIFCPFYALNRTDVHLEAFIARKQHFLQRCKYQREELQPFLPEIAYFEYIPGVPIVLPLTVTSAAGKTKDVSAIYEQLLNERKQSFENFIQETLGLRPQDGSEKIGDGIHELMQQVEEDFNELLLPGDTHTRSGMQALVEQLFKLVPTVCSFSLKEEAAAAILKEFPPRSLLTLWGYRDIDQLLQERSALDVLALTLWSEEVKYSTQINDWLRDNLKPEDFGASQIKPLVVHYRDFPGLSSVKETPVLSHLTSRVVLSNLRPGSGGEFPKTRLLTTILKSIIDAEQFGRIWKSFAPNRKDFADMVLNSIEGHWGMHTFSAHSIFEDSQQRYLQRRLCRIADYFQESDDRDMRAAGLRLSRLAKGYHLGLTLPDGRFVTASLWSWASYSFKGGRGIPSPLSLLIERRWFNGELFMRCLEETGGNREEMYAKVMEMMGQGRESEDLSALYLEAFKVDKKIILPQKLEKEPPPARHLARSPYNPLLTPIKENSWESKYVLNCGAIRLDGQVHIVYRAVGEDGISRLGLALSRDGLRIDERLPEPIFVPEHKSEGMGCEDPRLIAIDGRVYMLYTAYDGITPQIALASIDIDDMINRRWGQWYRHGLVFPGLPNKDAILFPERFDGKLAMFHRIIPSIWVTFADTLEAPWPKEGHNIVLGIRSGMMWDAVKIGAGAQPLKTKYGWLLIYHGVDYSLCYRLGVILNALDDPTEVLYRSPNPILEPATSYEKGTSGQSWVPNVVFTCGAVSVEDKEILDADDEILVYYGGADTVIGVASATVGDLIPARFRNGNSGIR